MALEKGNESLTIFLFVSFLTTGESSLFPRLASDFPFDLAKVDAGSHGQSHTAAWGHCFDLPTCRGTRPGLGREILQAPNPRIGRVARHRRDGLGKVIEPLRIDVVGKDLGVMVEHDDLFANGQVRGAHNLSLAGPAPR